jgi:hypothetical protein
MSRIFAFCHLEGIRKSRMKMTPMTAFVDAGAASRFVNELPGAGSCACDPVAIALESVPGPRVRRAAQGDDLVIECVDPQDSENEPATMMQRIPA